MQTADSSTSRLQVIDLTRGLALLAMTLFHFCWDLAMFGVIDPQVMSHPAMIWFARCIAGTFLFLVGFSLHLAHAGGIRWRSFSIRLGQIALAALAITVATYFLTPDAFIFFGILHAIALASILGLGLLPLPWWLNCIIAAIFLVGTNVLSASVFDQPLLWWTGLSPTPPVSNDFVPLFPFFGMVVLGIAMSEMSRKYGMADHLRRIHVGGFVGKWLPFIGRNSLIYYLLHQPVMIAMLAGILKIIGHI